MSTSTSSGNQFKSLQSALHQQQVSQSSSLRACRALVSGAAAGVSVDISLYPIDTLKTRLQSFALSSFVRIKYIEHINLFVFVSSTHIEHISAYFYFDFSSDHVRRLGLWNFYLSVCLSLSDSVIFT